MTDELQSTPESQPQDSNGTPDVISSPPKKANKKLWILLGVVVCLIGCCSIICIAVIGLGVYSANKSVDERAPVMAVLDSYMRYMVARDAESAYALFSPRAKRQIPLSEIQAMFEGNNYILFDGYQSLTVTDFTITKGVNTNPDVPQGTVAKVSGTITYKGGFQGSFSSVLEKVDGTWQLDGISVVVPPSKIN